MSIYTLIEKELTNINEAKFEHICNAFISHEYRGDLYGLGTVKGKEKSRKGKPDAFILQKDGTYIIAEYTTRSKSDNENAFLKKIETDITGCLNFNKLGIKASQVAMVVICCNSNFSISEIEKLKSRIKASDIGVRIVGIDSLALFLFSKGRYYANQHLNIPFDTGQILDRSDFLEFYGKRNLTTPLDNELVGRQKELSKLLEKINTHDILIVSGQPGVGKSKLCLEAISLFLKQQPQHSEYHDYYIVSKTGGLWEDLKGILEHGKNYIFFVDDANRQINNLLNIIHSTYDNDNVSIKIVITVRNYVQEEVLSVCNTLRPAIFHLGKMPKRSIREIICERKSDIQLASYLNRIIEISDGNPRIAIMAAHVIRHDQNPMLLKDVAMIYDQYFQTFEQDKKIFADADIVKTLGIISFFYSLDLESKEIRTLLDDFHMPYERFVELVFMLEKLEFVEVYLKNMVRMSEQMLATFAFHKAFIQERLLDFDILLSKYSRKTFATIKDIMGPVYTAFGEKQAMDNIRGILIRHFNNYKENFDRCIAFLSVFGTSIPDQALLFARKYCSQMSATEKYGDSSEHIHVTMSSESHPILTILLPIIKKGSETEIISAMALSIMYAEKVPNTYEAILFKMFRYLRFVENDLVNNVNRQKVVYKFLRAQIGKSDTGGRMFFHLFRKILLSNFRERAFYTKAEAGWKISAPITQLREQFWQDINSCFKTHTHLCRSIIKDYITDTPRTSVTALRYDEPYLVSIFLSHFRTDSFEDCRLVYKYLDIVDVYYSPSDRLLKVRQHFYSPAINVFSKLSAYNPIKIYSSRPGWEINESKISTLTVDCIDDFKKIYDLLLESLPYWREPDKMSYTLGFWIASVIKKDCHLGLVMLQFIIDDGNKIGLATSNIFESLSTILQEKYEQVFSLIREKKFYDCDNWVYEYFSKLKSVASTEYLMHEAMKYFATSVNIGKIFSDYFNNFLCFDKDIHEKILILLFGRVERGDKFEYKLSEYFFLDNKALAKKHFIICKRLYFDLKSRYHGYDSSEVALFILYEADSNILFDYLDYLETTSHFTNHKDDRPSLSEIWGYDDAAVNMEEVIVRYKKNQDFEPLGHVCCIFFNYLSESNRSKVEAFFRSMIDKYSDDSEILNIILDVARTCVKQSYVSMVQYFLQANGDYNMFKSMYWIPKWVCELGPISELEMKAFKLSELHDAIKELGEPIKFIEHIEHLTQEMHRLQAYIAEYKRCDFMGDFPWPLSRKKLEYYE